MWEKFTSSSKRAIKIAHEEARYMRCSHVAPEHVLLGILKDEASFATKMLLALNADVQKIRFETLQKIPLGDLGYGVLNFSDPAKKALEVAYMEARSLRHTFIGSEHLLLAILKLAESDARAVLVANGVTYESLREVMVGMTQQGPYPEPLPKPEPVERARARAYDFRLLDMRMSELAQQALLAAYEEAKKSGASRVSIDHLLLGLLRIQESKPFKFLDGMGITYESARDGLREMEKEPPETEKNEDAGTEEDESEGGDE